MDRQESDSEKVITTSLIAFINQHIQSSHLDSLDEIVLNYVVTVLENLATESLKNIESFDVEEFCEMLSAYFPEFASIPQSVVSEWIFELVSSLKKSSQKGGPYKEATFESLLEEITTEPRTKRCSESSDSSGNGSKKSSSSRTPRVSETSDSESEVVDIIQRLQLCQLQLEEKVQTLIEMFPSLSRVDAQNFVSLSNGDLEKSVQMVLLQIESGNFGNMNQLQTPGSVALKPRTNGGRSRENVDERVLKDRIVARYGFIDQAEDGKEFRPIPPKDEPKKLVRYREGMVVSTKGERFSEEKTKDYLAKPHKPQN